MQNQSGQNPDLIRYKYLDSQRVTLLLNEERYIPAAHLSNKSELVSILTFWDLKDSPSKSDVMDYIRVGSVTINQPNRTKWFSIKIKDMNFTNPIVIMGPVSNRGGDAVTT